MTSRCALASDCCSRSSACVACTSTLSSLSSATVVASRSFMSFKMSHVVANSSNDAVLNRISRKPRGPVRYIPSTRTSRWVCSVSWRAVSSASFASVSATFLLTAWYAAFASL